VGFLSTLEEEPGRHKFARYDTTKPGHGNAAISRHRAVTSDKDALLEYLKTL
jgi:hypothetical protein